MRTSPPGPRGATSPVRLVVLGIGGLLLLLAALTALSWHLQTRALSEALVTDVRATLALRIARSTPAKHRNGYECFAEVARMTPGDLAPFDVKSTETFKEVMDAGVVPDDWQPRLQLLEPWAEDLRGCGDAEGLEFVPGLDPFDVDTKERGPELLLALSRLTRLQARQGAMQGDWPGIAERCVTTLEVSVDRGQLNLIGAMVSASVVRQLLPVCGEALARLEPDARARVADRFGALPQRLVTNHELLERERQLITLGAYAFLVPSAQRARLPEGLRLFDLGNALTRVVLARTWGRHDRAMRALVAVADTPGAVRQQAGRDLDDVFSAWWAPVELAFSPDYEKFLRRNDDARVALRLLAHLARPRDEALPEGVTRTGEGFEVLQAEGASVLVPTPAPGP